MKVKLYRTESLDLAKEWSVDEAGIGLMVILDVYLKGMKVGSLVDEPSGLAFSHDAEYADLPRSELPCWRCNARSQTLVSGIANREYFTKAHLRRNICPRIWYNTPL